MNRIPETVLLKHDHIELNCGNTKIKQTRREAKKAYTREMMENAIKFVKSGVSISRSASLCGVPRSTMRDYISGKTSFDKKHKGRYLSPEDENTVKNWYIASTLQGCKPSGMQINRFTQCHLNSNNIKSQFQDNLPKKQWAFQFKKRHNLSGIKPVSSCSVHAIAYKYDNASIKTIKETVPSSTESALMTTETSEKHKNTVKTTSYKVGAPPPQNMKTELNTLSNMSPHMALDRLLDIAAKGGLHKLVRCRALHTLQVSSDDVEEQMFCLIYDWMISHFQGE